MVLRRKIRAGFIAAVAAGLALGLNTAAATFSSLPIAEAATPNSVVVGDSLPANPTLADYVASKSSHEFAKVVVPTGRINEAGCGSDSFFTNTYANVSGHEARNFTCPGASLFTGGQHVNNQLDAAANKGALGAQTREVIIFASANDVWARLVHGEQLPNIEHQLYDALRDSINQAHRLAPNARVKVVGVPSVSNNQGGVCLVNIIPNLPMGIPAGIVTQSEDALQRAQSAAARDGGATYVDARELTRGHDTCSNDRWVAGIVDTTVKSPQTLMLHMTQHGLAELATATVRS